MKTTKQLANVIISKLANWHINTSVHWVLIAFIFFQISVITVFAQEKRTISFELSFYKKSDLSKIVIANVKAKNEKKKFAPAAGVPVSFYALKNNEQISLGQVTSDIEGKAQLNLPEDLPFDKDGYFNITAKIENNNLYEDAEESVHYKDVNFSIKLNPADTGKTVTAVVTEKGSDGIAKPVKDVDIKFYVQRFFGDMPAAEDNSATTDDKGEAFFTFPKDIPGDTGGNIVVIAKIEDNDIYGNVEKKESINWGVPVHYTRENSGINLSLLWGEGSHEGLDTVFYGIISIIVMLILITFVMYKRA